MKKNLILYFVTAILFIASTCKLQQKEFAIGFENCVPDIYHPDYPIDTLIDLNSNTIQAGHVYDASLLSYYHSKGIKYSFFQPKFITIRGSRGQQTIYQAEETDLNSSPVSKYKYRNHVYGVDMTDNSQYGNGERVRYFEATSTTQNNPDTVLKKADERLEQTGGIVGWFTDKLYGTDSINTWYIKPKMRIDPTYAKNNPGDTVVKIEVRAYNGDVIRTVYLKCENFLDGTGNYDGKYMEEFNLPSQSLLQVLADTVSGLNKGRDYGQGPDSSKCKVDYRIYWLGKVSFWIDYVKVEDFYANKLFKGEYDQFMKGEMNNLLQNSNSDLMTSIFTEEIHTQNIPCMKYVNDSMKVWFPGKKNARTISLFNDRLIDAVNIKKETGKEKYRQYLEGVDPSVLIVNNNYQFWAYHGWSPHYYLPNNVDAVSFPEYIFPEAEKTAIYVKYAQEKTDINTYNNYLQTTVLNTWSNSCKDANEVSKERNIDYWVVPQVHHWKNANTQWQREPLNEEYSAVVCVALAQGAKGIMGYDMVTFAHDALWEGYELSMLEWAPNDVISFAKNKRKYNFYGQPKWSFLKELNAKIKRWGDILVSSASTEGYNVSISGSGHNFINDIKSFYRNSSMQYTNEDAIKYWEMGFFKPVDANDKSKYFMMVNRRCVPETSSGAGDLRELRIKFDVVNLSGYNNWKVIDVNTNQTVLTVNNNSGTFYNMGVFNPGEGKLYKLEPVN